MNKKIFLKCKIRFFLIWLIFVGLAFGNAFAVPMTREQASMAVSTWLSRGASLTSELSGGVLDVIDVKSPDKATIGYLVRLTKGGFVVTSSDDRVMPILCFSAENVDNFVQDSSNPLYEFLCVNVSEQMGVTKSEEPIPMSSPDGTYTQNKWSSLLSPPMPMSNGKSAISDVRVSPLLSTKWSQDNIGGKPCYNYYTPNNYVCGCVATAYAQVMKFYGYPTNSVPQVSNTCYVDEVSATYSTIGGVYDWNNMPKVPSSSMTDTQR